MWLPELWINLSFEYAIVKLEPRPAAEILGFGGTIILWQWHRIIAFSAVDSDRQHSNGTMDGDTTILAFVFFYFLLLVTAWIHRTWRLFGWIQLKAPTVGRKRATKRLSLLMRDRFHLTVFRNTHISSVRTERIGGTVQRRQNSDGIWSRARQVQLLRQSLLWIIERV